MIPAALGELLDSETMPALVALLAEMDERGCRFVVHGSDEISYDGPDLPEWCDAVLAYWLDLVVCVHAAARTHRLYCCSECGELMLLSTGRAKRGCWVPGCVGRFDVPVTIRFVDGATTRAPAPMRITIPRPASATTTPAASTNCTHSLATEQPDGTTRCSYCSQEVTT